MELLNFIFQLGVVFAIYGFLWGIFELGLSLLFAGRKRQVVEIYVLKTIKYLFLVDVTFLFVLDPNTGDLSLYQAIMAGSVLLVYFLGKLQNSQQRIMVFQMLSNTSSGPGVVPFDIRWEIGTIVIALSAFTLMFFMPELASNNISNWFHESIVKIEDTPVIGFIFKVIGFFFLMSLLIKMFNAFIFLLSGQAFKRPKGKNPVQHDSDREDFDDYEEIN